MVPSDRVAATSYNLSIVTMSPSAAVWPQFPMKCIVSCILPTQGHVSSDGPEAAMETNVLLLEVLGCGAIFWHILD